MPNFFRLLGRLTSFFLMFPTLPVPKLESLCNKKEMHKLHSCPYNTKYNVIILRITKFPSRPMRYTVRYAVCLAFSRQNAGKNGPQGLFFLREVRPDRQPTKSTRKDPSPLPLQPCSLVRKASVQNYLIANWSSGFCR